MTRSVLKLAPLAIVAFIIGCGSRTTQASATDGGTPGLDAGSGDGSFDTGVVAKEAGVDAPELPDGAVLPHGSQLVTSNVITLNGVTTDGWVAYTDTSANELFVVPVAGGSPTSIASLGRGSMVATSGPVVWFSTPATASMYSGGVGTVSIWTSAHGTQMLSKQSLLYPTVSASGNSVLYLDNVNFDTGVNTVDVYAANTDGSGKTKLVSAASVEGYLELAFGGEVAVVMSSTNPVDGGPIGPATLAAFSAPSWGEVALATDVVGASLGSNPSGTLVMAQSAAGLTLYPVDGTAPTLIDTAGVGGQFTADGANVVYTTSSGALYRASATSAAPPPTKLVASGFPNVVGLSPDGSWVLGAVAPTATPSQDGDLYFASAAMAGSSLTLSMTANVAASLTGPLGGAMLFTADSSHVIFASDTSGDGLSTLRVIPVSEAAAGGSTYPGVWSFVPTTLGTVVYNNHYDPIGGVGSNGTADIEHLDTMGGTATVLVSQADANFFVTADQKSVVYSWSYLSGESAGVWTIGL